MRKTYLSFFFALVSCVTFANNETVCVLSNSSPSGEYCNPSNLGPINPCGVLFFKVNKTPPQDYPLIAKYEWFVNGVSVKTTTDPNDPVLQWTLLTNSTNVYCKVTYKNAVGTLSSAYTSNTFTPIIKVINFDDIATSTPSPNYGCTTSTVSYNLNTYTCGSDPICDFVYTVTGSYNITWQAPAGWVQTSISPNGNAVSFTPDATSAGPLTATIHLPCGYTETRIFNTIRVAQTAGFTIPDFTFCGTTGTVSVNAPCGASGYTYTITGNPGVTFTANGLQTLTTSSTTVNVSIVSGISSISTIKVKANYPGSISSAEVSTSLTTGKPQPGSIGFLLIDPVFGKIQAEIDPVPGATSYNWYKNGVMVTVPPVHGPFIQIPIPRVCDVEYDIAVEAINSCGTSLRTHQNAYVPCDFLYMISPNPASDNLAIAADQTKSASGRNTTFNEVRIYDKQGNLKRYQKFGKVKTATINIAGLTNGTYFIEIVNGTFKERKQLLIQR